MEVEKKMLNINNTLKLMKKSASDIFNQRETEEEKKV